MSVFASILVPLDGSRLAARGLGCATWLAARLGARLHVLCATPRELPARAELARLQVPEEHWPLVTLHQAPAYPESAILAALARHRVELVVMSAGGQTAEGPEPPAPDPERVVGHVTRAIVEQSPVPVLLIPPGYREALPWRRALVPVSGETDADAALALAVRLANALGLAVDVAHVADGDEGPEALAARARYADALHHEYPAQLDELVGRALPRCSPAECRCIERVTLVRGDAAAELLALGERAQTGVVVVGWHGDLTTGHAGVLKRLIAGLACPLLLVKPAGPGPFRLMVGPAIE
jgi:nucleotide-binding universal stress UspA family protein